MMHYLVRHIKYKKNVGRTIVLMMSLLACFHAYAQKKSSLDTQPLSVTAVCSGSDIDVTGVRNFANGDFRVELSDGGTVYTEIPSTFLSASGRYEITCRATIPASTTGGSNYQIRLVAMNPTVIGTPSPTVLTIRPLPTATLTGNQTIYEGKSAQLSVSFTGDGHWTFSYQDSTATGLGNVLNVSTNLNPYTFEVKPLKTTAYLLRAVSNLCGSGTLTNRVAVVTVAPLLAAENQLADDAVQVYPIPAGATLTVHIRESVITEMARLELTDMMGRKLFKHETRQATSWLMLDQHPPGIYMLHIQIGDRTVSKRIVKF